MKLSENIFLIRKAKWNMTQENFGKVMGVSKSQVVSYEKSGIIPKIDFLLRLEEVSGVPVYDLCKRLVNLSEILDQPFLGIHKFSNNMSRSPETYSNQEIETLIKTIGFLQKKLEDCEKQNS